MGRKISARARSRGGISDATYTRVMVGLKPDTSVFAAVSSQPEFKEKIWQYLNRRVSDWRIQTGKEKLKEHGALLARIEKDIGVDRSILLALWGIESAYGDPDVQKNLMRPVFPSLAALAWGEPRRRAYWEQELINALRIVERGWSTPAEMRGSWAGAMGHTQWMPEVWLNIGMDYDGDGRVNPFGRPDDALASSARYLINRGKYRRGEHWGYEVRAGGQRGGNASRSYEAWQKAGVTRADGKPFPSPKATAKLWVPVQGGPGFPARPEFLRRAQLQSVDELHARDRAPRRRDHGRRTGRRRNFPAASARRRWPRSRKSSAASPRLASTPRAPTAASAPPPCRRSAISSARSAWSRTAMPG